MITLQQANELCILAHKDQWRRPEPAKGLAGLPNLLITMLQRGELDGYEHNGLRYSYINGDILTLMVQEPYIVHPIAVADMMDTEYRKILALLHDIIEDTHYDLYVSPKKTYYSIITDKAEYPQFTISKDLYVDLGLLTKDPNLTYEQNIRRIKESGRADAIAVKIADNIHNLYTGTEKQQQKYLGISLPILLGE